MKKINIMSALLISCITSITAMESQSLLKKFESWNNQQLSSSAAYKEYIQKEAEPESEISFHFAYQIYKVMMQANTPNKKKQLIVTLQDLFKKKTSSK